jgi:hypothetical protein
MLSEDRRERSMKRALVLMLLGILVLGAVALVGCGSKVTVKTENGKVTTTEKNGEVKVESEKGDTTVTTTKKVTESEIGVPIYPNAKMDENAAGSVSTKNEKGETTWSAAVMWTEDPVADVVSWYRDKLSGKPGFTDMSTTSGGEALGLMMFQAGDNTLKTVTIGKNTVDHAGTTAIAISSASGADVNLPK